MFDWGDLALVGFVGFILGVVLTHRMVRRELDAAKADLLRMAEAVKRARPGVTHQRSSGVRQAP